MAYSRRPDGRDHRDNAHRLSRATDHVAQLTGINRLAAVSQGVATCTR